MTRRKRRELLIDDPSLINKEFFFEGERGSAVLLIHGWSSTPYEMRAFGEHLQVQGYSVCAPLLSGHGTRPEDLEGLVWQDWRNDVLKAYTELKTQYDRVYVGGMSTGGSLAIHAALRFPDVAGLILLGTPYNMRYEKFAFYFARVMSVFYPYKKKYYPKILGNEKGMSELISYEKYPYKSAIEAFYAIKSATTQLSTLRLSCMIVQSRHDHLISKHSVKYFEKEMCKSHVRTRMIDKAYHNFIADKKNHYIFEEISGFLDECETSLPRNT